MRRNETGARRRQGLTGIYYEMEAKVADKDSLKKSLFLEHFAFIAYDFGFFSFLAILFFFANGILWYICHCICCKLIPFEVVLNIGIWSFFPWCYLRALEVCEYQEEEEEKEMEINNIATNEEEKWNETHTNTAIECVCLSWKRVKSWFHMPFTYGKREAYDNKSCCELNNK